MKSQLKIGVKKLKKEGWFEIRNVRGDISILINDLSKILNTEFLKETVILKPKTESKKFKLSLSGTFGFNSFPYHTDGAHFLIPPRYVVLRDLSTANSKTPTTILNPRGLSGSYLEDDIYFVSGGNSSFYTPLINKTIIPGQAIFRYNTMVMKRLSGKSYKSFDTLLQSVKPKKILWKKYKTIVIDNWAVLHGRGDVDKIGLKVRRIERTYLFNK